MRTTSENAYQLKVTLCDDDPPIWRRLVIPGNFTFSDLHVVIQDAMGWHDCHLHEFEITNPVTEKIEIIGVPEDDSSWDGKLIGGMKRRIANIFSLQNNKATYRYDYGDNWVHQVEIESIFPKKSKCKLPQCIQGEGDCPPEDCGGIDAYKSILHDIEAEDNRKQSDEMMEAITYWRKYAYLAENTFSFAGIFFRELPLKNTFSIEDGKLWMRRLLQGKISLDELKGDLCSRMPYSDIEALYDCVLNKPLHYRNRAVGILSFYKDIDQKAITEYLFIPKSTLRANFITYQSKGLSHILSDKGKRLLIHDDPKYIEKIFSILHSPPIAFGFNRTSWRQEDIQKVMKASDMHVSKHVIRKILDNAGYKYRKARIVLTSNDPEYKEKVQRIKDILSNLGPNEKFFSIDEYGPFAIKLQGGRSLVPPAATKVVPQWQRSKASLIITAALELSTNQIIHFYSKSKNTSEMIKLLNILVDRYSDEECIYFSWDAASWHASKELYKRVDEINGEEYREKTKSPIVKLAPLPTCAQFLNVIESVFSGMARAIIHNSDYASDSECQTAIDRYFDERNEYFQKNPKRAGNKIWGKERVKATFRESNNCKDPKY